MFTGIIEDVGTLADIKKFSGKWEFRITSSIMEEGIARGDSIAVDGVCLTATDFGKGFFSADASLETLKLTTLHVKKTGNKVNIERAMQADGRFGGHIVMGHVDGVGTIRDISREGDSIRLELELRGDEAWYVVKKGSIAIDGISLTVNEQHGNIITLNIIPFTVSKTTIGERKPLDKVNIETDIIGKYIQNFMNKGQSREIDLDFLNKYGFTRGKD